MLVALGLSFDTFAVSLSFGVVQNKIIIPAGGQELQLLLAIFQAGLLVTGYFLGSFVSDFIKAADHWIALGLLSFLGIRMMIEGLRRKENDEAT